MRKKKIYTNVLVLYLTTFDYVIKKKKKTTLHYVLFDEIAKIFSSLSLTYQKKKKTLLHSFFFLFFVGFLNKILLLLLLLLLLSEEAVTKFFFPHNGFLLAIICSICLYCKNNFYLIVCFCIFFCWLV